MTLSCRHNNSDRPIISLQSGDPDPSTLATPELRSAVATTIDAPDFYQALLYGKEQGMQGLIEFLVERINSEQVCSIGPANVMLVAGSTHAVDLLARLYAKPGGVVLVEAPTYPDAIRVFQDHHIELHALPMDQDGLIVSALEEQLVSLTSHGKRPSFLYTIPTFHNPTGCTLHEVRRRQIVEVASRHSLMIVEDDVYRDLSFRGQVPASFYALARGSHICSIGSFSKTLAPGLRLGWVVAPEDVIQTLIHCGTTQMGGGANPFSAYVVSHYCCHGDWERHVSRLCRIYKARCDLMLAALERNMPPLVSWTRPEGGFFIWLTLPPCVRARDVARASQDVGVSLAAGEAFFLDPRDGERHLRLAYSYAPPHEFDAAMYTVGRVVDGLQAGAP